MEFLDTHVCIEQPALTKLWSYDIFVQILSTYSRYTGRLFPGCAFFVARFNIIRAS